MASRDALLHATRLDAVGGFLTGAALGIAAFVVTLAIGNVIRDRLARWRAQQDAARRQRRDGARR